MVNHSGGLLVGHFCVDLEWVIFSFVLFWERTCDFVCNYKYAPPSQSIDQSPLASSQSPKTAGPVIGGDRQGIFPEPL